MAEDSPKRVPWVDQALSEIEGYQEEFVSLIARITEIPAPSHQEQERGAFVARTMREFGLSVVQTDPSGNVLGFLPGKDSSRVIVSMAHMDTVFPIDTPLKVKREGWSSSTSTAGWGDSLTRASAQGA